MTDIPEPAEQVALPEQARLSEPAALPEQALRLAEAALFASAEPVPPRALATLLPGLSPDAVLAALQARYAGRGVELAEVAGGWMFRTAPDLTPTLTRVISQPRRLPRVAMETLAIIAYHQPVTRAEVEEIRGASLSQSTLDALLEAGLVAPKGRKEVPGRPTLWGTTPGFLLQFGLSDLRDLPRREDLLVDPSMVTTGPAEAADIPEVAEDAASILMADPGATDDAASILMEDPGTADDAAETLADEPKAAADATETVADRPEPGAVSPGPESC